MSKDFSELVGEALGKASMAWSETPVGIFDSDACCVLHIDIMNAHNEEIKNLQDENAKLKECVEFYANEETWFEERIIGYPIALDDEGGLARKVLKQLNNTDRVINPI